MNIFFYSEKQRFGECTNKVETPDGFKEYTEWCSISQKSNWDDAVLVFETEESPKIIIGDCGVCPRCEIMRLMPFDMFGNPEELT